VIAHINNAELRTEYPPIYECLEGEPRIEQYRTVA
jgi:hypothetical protein